ncbi:MAG: hypothetical protein A2Y25_06885 [Candidatus Melainabacteria bacterium GWF2_37_15]|nr:MAG: hypothetical protein A2Y25_06885 [Candidatus Melainabacteria bacterium GWF2_37_15]
MLIVCNKPVFAEIISVTCGSATSSTNWPRKTFKYSCTATASELLTSTRYKIGVYTSNYTTTKTGTGNGSNLTYNDFSDTTDPAHPNGTYRFQADGPAQGRTGTSSINITTDSQKNKVTIIQDDFTHVTSQIVNFDVYYRTYERDCGDTDYNQGLIVGLYGNTSGNMITSGTLGSPLAFTTENKYYLSISAPPTVNITTSYPVFDLNNYYDSNTFTVNVKSNSTWKLQTKLNSGLSSGGNSIPAASNYFRASGSGFNNLAPGRTQFATANTYYDVAQNSAGVYTTGTSDNINLAPAAVSVTYSLKITDIFNTGTYTTTNLINLVTP